MTQEDFEEYVGKILNEDFTQREVEEKFPQDNVFVGRLGALGLAGFKPDRIRIWVDDDNRVVKMVRG